MLQLTGLDNLPIYFPNVQSIMAVTKDNDENGTRVYTMSDSDCWLVKESAQEILTAIGSILNKNIVKIQPAEEVL